MRRRSITVKHAVLINKPKEVVWDFTQDYNNRSKWDSAVLEATVLQLAPKIVWLKLKGAISMTFVYKLEDRPNKTTLAVKEVQSSIIESGGGSWTYSAQNNGTLWSQVNTLVFKNTYLLPLLLPVYKWMLHRQTIRAMNKARKLIEQL